MFAYIKWFACIQIKIAPKNYRFICSFARMRGRESESKRERDHFSRYKAHINVVEFLMIQMCNCVGDDHTRTYFMRLLSRFHELLLSMFIWFTINYRFTSFTLLWPAHYCFIVRCSKLKWVVLLFSSRWTGVECDWSSSWLDMFYNIFTISMCFYLISISFNMQETIKYLSLSVYGGVLLALWMPNQTNTP